MNETEIKITLTGDKDDWLIFLGAIDHALSDRDLGSVQRNTLENLKRLINLQLNKVL